jgi:hypothetical protein
MDFSSHLALKAFKVTLLWEISDIAMRNQWHCYEKSVTLLWEIRDITVTLLWEISDIAMRNQWLCYDIAMRNQWHYCDIAMRNQWHCYEKSILTKWVDNNIYIYICSLLQSEQVLWWTFLSQLGVLTQLSSFGLVWYISKLSFLSKYVTFPDIYIGSDSFVLVWPVDQNTVTK